MGSPSLRFRAQHPHPTVRAHTAASEDCPPDVLEQLARDSAWEVRAAVAENPNCPPAVLERLRQDRVWPVRDSAGASD